MRHIGSQTRETLEESEYTFVSREGDEVILENEDGGKELFVERDDYAGYVVEIDGIGHEFVRSL